MDRLLREDVPEQHDFVTCTGLDHLPGWSIAILLASGLLAGLASPAKTSRPQLLVVAGPNGAGKTTITERGLAHEWFHDCEYVNPDTIAQNELGDWNDAQTVLRAAQLATERREACLRERRSFAFETVFSAADKPAFVRRALALGATS